MRFSAFAMLLGAAVGLPYIMNSGAIDATVVRGLFRDRSSTGVQGMPSAGASRGTATTATGLGTSATPYVAVVSRSVIDLGEILRFDVDPSWVVKRFPRVSTGLSDLDQHGYRVPLVSGTAEDDVAGALTYFFNPQQKLERITLYGTTGDPRKLVSTVCRMHGLKPVTADEPGIFAYKKKTWRGATRSELLVRPASVARAEWSRAKYVVEMVLKP